MSDQANLAAAAAAKPAPAAPRPSGSGDTVTVACKLPSGFVMQLYEMEPVFEPVLGGGQRETTRARKVGEDYELNGYAMNLVEISKGNPHEHEIVGGYGLTPGIPRDVWEKWEKDNHDSSLVKNKIIFAQDKPDQARDAAKERVSVKSGLEPLDPENPGARNPEFRKIRRGTRNDSDADNM